ncbi:transglutaminase-like cysteine peptidase [Aquabacterium sp. J223]|uniref:transglutaminase-like cysteine peptidase n=1 Tax=Aquabacterium sp. J223 TaxID=2898431 RepID=UPI0021ADDF05|nr:transglutaminase-like cysteine peptidase [Aquabacterium sp. J223]UUX94024.1 transglutaminase-like cysteine peptidase [Aquabacterium sp. J223]
MAWLGLAGALPTVAQESVRAQAAARLGPRAAQAQRALEPLLQPMAAGEVLDRLEAVNRFFNHQIRFREDAQVWGLPDHWASPFQALGRGEGDCEDYAIGKYFSLLAAGLPAPRLRLVYVKVMLPGQTTPQPHMVLAYHPPEAHAEPLVLDNLMDALLPASRRPDLQPVFSFNSEGLWQGSTPAGDPLRRLSRWREVAERARDEGFVR